MAAVQKLNAAAEQAPLPTTDGFEGHDQTTFQMWGEQLPIGILDGGELHRSFGFKVYDLAIERELALKRKKTRASAEYVVEVLSTVLTVLGPHADFQALNHQQRKLVIQRMWLPDVLYAYFSLRREALGDELSASCTCPTCSHKWKYVGDLAMGDVKVVTGPEAISWRHEMRHGLMGKDGDRIKSAVLQPPRWECMLGITRKTGRTNAVMVKVRVIASCIRQLGDGTTPLTEHVIDTMSKYDIEHITKALDDCVPGPDMTLEPECPECGTELRIPINWDWDFFFGAASL